uniref:Uncharacterized protein ycf23 n=1 Tax=Kumanoa americana TaxID=1196377 RepID=A0A1C9CGK0_9FLOR|nr:hypothetical protein Kuma_082 [Kumanoa americana]AOM67516.1 hypothetical protein Kuma_082 [Kumanoa americana]
MILDKKLNNALCKRSVVKVITGINNFNLNEIIVKAKAAEIAGATYLDIAANVDILYQVKQISSLPICVSSIDIDELFACFKAGASILEIGNFDVFYNKGIAFSSSQVLNLAKQLVNRAPSACICVTIPHTLKLQEQISLAQHLEFLGVDMVQTEGVSSKMQSNSRLINSLSNASASLSSTYVLAKFVNIPIISSSSINPLSAPIAISYGASGVGIGSFLSNFHHSLDISLVIRSIVQSMNDNLDLNANNNNLLLSSILSQSVSKI